MAEDNPERTLRVFAIAFALLAISNLLKPLELGETTGFVFFGQRLSGTPNLIAGVLFGIYLLVYAWGIWRMKRFVVGMAHAYAVYVVLNLLLYWSKNPMPPGIGAQIFGFVYMFVALGVSGGAAFLLTKHKALLS
jgi:hypothetical protein